MPNWCFSTLSVSGPATHITEFIEFAKSKTDDSVLSFRNFLPMPEALEVGAGSDGDLGYAVFHSESEWQRYLGYPWVRKLNITTLEQLRAYVETEKPEAKAAGDLYAQNLKSYGAKHWYDWCVTYWGTKWDACSASIVQRKECNVIYSFRTAWSSADPVFLAMSAQFPYLDFYGHFDEEAGFFRFEATWLKGEKTSEVSLLVDED